MRGLGLAVAGALILVLAGCGTVETSSSTVPSEKPDAVASASDAPSAAPSTAGNSTDVKVVVDGAGFSVGGYGQGGYGLALKNTSTTMDAEEVQVTVNLLDKSGTIITTADQTFNLIPAGGTFYFGGDFSVDKGAKPAKMEAFVDVGASEAAQYSLPKVSKVRVVKDQYAGVSVKGQATNDLDGPNSSMAVIGCVLLDANDKVVTGGYGYLNNDLPSGRTVGFENYINITNAAASKVTHAEASMDNVSAE